MVKETTGKLDYKKTFILGFGFFAISLVWPLYNNYVPLFLLNFFDSQFVINCIMTLDNILAIFLIPYISALSDNTHTRFGKRKPFIMIGLPISALMFIILPLGSNNLILFLIIITILNFSMAIYRGPTVALMPDMVPPHQRSEANAVINFMGGLAAVFVLYGGSRLYEIDIKLPFSVTGIIMFISLIIIICFIKEPVTSQKSTETREKVKIIATLRGIIINNDHKTFHLLFAILFWFIGYQGMEATFSNYMFRYIGLPKHESGIILSAFAGAFLLFAIPAGFIGKKIGKKRAILIGLITDIIIFIFLGLIGPLGIIIFNKYLVMILLAVAGIFWSLININSYPYIVEGVSESKVGTFTGFYYFSSSVAAISGPMLFGIFVDLIGYNVLFFLTAISFIIAFLFIYTIRQPNKII
ncbi:MFS transporter [Vallitalea longa]|uniref:MFS transporter n=1 Tax=Vallitalea longa TaxID=2936439 RepID=A0A9W5YAL2_9FIRM|nr:MFS transporter [Vallitalea longa]GKX30427.1 MFS transporter [Vallitalea longa]